MFKKILYCQIDGYIHRAVSGLLVDQSAIDI